MTSFVLENAKQPYVEGTKYKDLVNYAKFLKQPLKLEMFVPCDEEGNVLEEPKRWKDYLQYPDSFDGNKEWDELYDYQQAKEKVLFEGFEIFKGTIYMCSVPMLKVKDLYQTTIEDLIYYEPILTENAVKQIEL